MIPFSIALFSNGSSIVSSRFYLEVDTTQGGSAADTFVLPTTNSGYDATVYWGDSSSEVISGSPGNVTHVYATAGTYLVSVAENAVGGFPRIFFSEGGDCLKVTKLRNFGVITWASMSAAFAGCANMVITATDGATANTGAVTIWTTAFKGCAALTSFPLLDTSAATNLIFTWDSCSALTSFPLIDTSAVTDFAYAWSQCSVLTSFPLIDTGLGTDFTSAWQGCAGLTSFPLIDTSNATKMVFTWWQCGLITSFPLIDTGSVTDFSSAWAHCGSLTSFPLIDTSGITNFNGLQDTWYLCFNLTSFPPISLPAALTSLTATWDACGGLTTFPLINTSSVTNFDRAWQNCASLGTFPAIDVSAGYSFIATWSGCGVFGTFPAMDMDGMVYGTDCFAGSEIPQASYDQILDSCAANNLNTGVTFHAGTSTYSASEQTDRNTLTVSRSWVITDGGVA